MQALDVVLALLDPPPVPSDSANTPDSPQAVTELHGALQQHTVQASTPCHKPWPAAHHPSTADMHLSTRARADVGWSSTWLCSSMSC